MIRRLGPGDVLDYRAIRLSALATSPDAFGSLHAVEAARPIETFAERLCACTVFGGYVGSAIVGMVGLRRQDGPKDAHKAFVWGFFVEPAHRGRGIGASLLAAALDAASAIVEQVTLSVVSGSAAISLYERAGFIRYGTEPRALKTEAGYWDEALMVLMLSPSGDRRSD